MGFWKSQAPGSSPVGNGAVGLLKNHISLVSKPNLRLFSPILACRVLPVQLLSQTPKLPHPQTRLFYSEDSKCGLVSSMSCCSCLWLPCPSTLVGSHQGRGALQPRTWFWKAAPWRYLCNPSWALWLVLRMGWDEGRAGGVWFTPQPGSDPVFASTVSTLAPHGSSGKD